MPRTRMEQAAGDDAGMEEELWKILMQQRAKEAGRLGDDDEGGEEEGGDFIEYHLYLDDLGATTKDAAAQLEAAAALVLEVTAPHRAAYPWQQDAFRLGVVVPTESESESASSSSSEEPPHLHGLVRVAEAMEDEWFVLWLLRLATAHPPLAAKGLTARVADADGDILLIDASPASPHAWLESPDVGAHRAWIRGGQARFIAEDLCPPAKALSLCAALQLLRTHAPARTAAPWLEAAIAERVHGYPERIAAETHHAACYMPPAAAALLAARPHLSAAAVRALGSREPGELAGLSKGDAGRRFAPTPVLVPLRLPFAQRVYGQLRYEEAQPPKAFLGPIAEVLAREGGERGQAAWTARVQAAVERGVRLSCGLEILYRRSLRRPRQQTAAPASTSTSNSCSWQGYLGRLHARGFFDGVIEGSADHTARLGRAREAFARRERQAAAMEVARPVPDPGMGVVAPIAGPLHEWVDALLAAMDPKALTAEAYPCSLSALPPDDDEGWLDIEASQLEAMLERYGQSAQQAGEGQPQQGQGLFGLDSDDEEEEDGEEAGDADIEALLEGMKSFMGTMGGLEGAEMAAPASSASSGPGGRDPVSFDVGRLLSILRGDDVKEALQREGVGPDDDDEKEEGEGEEEEEEAAAAAAVRMDVQQQSQPQPQPQQQPQQQEEQGAEARGFRMREIPRGGDSDIDSDDGVPGEEEEEEGGEEAMEMEAVMAAYMAQLDGELAGTTMEASFERAPASAKSAAAAEAAAAAGDDEDTDAAELPPVDLDLNLVRHLLDSVASQGAAPGPASNLLNELFEGRRRAGAK